MPIMPYTVNPLFTSWNQGCQGQNLAKLGDLLDFNRF